MLCTSETRVEDLMVPQSEVVLSVSCKCACDDMVYGLSTWQGGEMWNSHV